MMHVYHQLFSVFFCSKRAEWRWLAIASVAMAGLEVLGLGLVFPFLFLVLQGKSSFLVLLLLSLVIVCKVILGVLTLRWQLSYAERLKNSLVSAFLNQMSNARYEYFIERDRHVLTNFFQSLIHYVVTNYIMAGITIFALTIVSLFIIVFLIVMFPLLSLCLALICIPYYLLIQRIAKIKAKKVGMEYSTQRKEMQFLLYRFFESIRDFVLYHRRTLWVKKIDDTFLHITSDERRIIFYQLLPTSLSDLVLLTLALVSFSLLSLQYDSATQVVALLATLMAAGYRLVPSIHRWLQSYAQMKASFESAQELLREYQVLQVNQSKPDEQITVSNRSSFESLSFGCVKFHYRHLSPNFTLSIDQLEIKRGQLVAVVGDSGAGKSTFVNVAMGLLTARSGTIELNGQLLTEGNLLAYQNCIGHVDDQIVICHGLDFFDPDILARYQLDHLSSRLATSTLGLSSGERQRLALVRALSRKSQILFFDEPSAHLDYKSEQQIYTDLLQLKGKLTVVVATHQLGILAQCDQIIYFDRGRATVYASYKELVAENPQYLMQRESP